MRFKPFLQRCPIDAFLADQTTCFLTKVYHNGPTIEIEGGLTRIVDGVHHIIDGGRFVTG